MEDSFVLLSSMSPKIKVKKSKPSKRAPTKLALRKHFRKSLAIDHLNSTGNQNICLGNDEYIESSSAKSSEISDQQKNTNFKKKYQEDKQELNKLDVQNQDDSYTSKKSFAISSISSGNIEESIYEQRDVSTGEVIVIEDSVIEDSIELNDKNISNKFTVESLENFNESFKSLKIDNSNENRVEKWISDTNTCLDIVDTEKELNGNKLEEVPESSYEEGLDNENNASVNCNTSKSSLILIELPSSPATRNDISSVVQSLQENEINLNTPNLQNVFGLKTDFNPISKTILTVNNLDNAQKSILDKLADDQKDNASFRILDETENVLDQLYGSTWRTNREKILTPLSKKISSKQKNHSLFSSENSFNVESPLCDRFRFVTPRRKNVNLKISFDSPTESWRPDLTKENLQKEEENLAIDLVSSCNNSLSRESTGSCHIAEKDSEHFTNSPFKTPKEKKINPKNDLIAVKKKQISQFSDDSDEEYTKEQKSLGSLKLSDDESDIVTPAKNRIKPPKALTTGKKKRNIIYSSDSEDDSLKNAPGSDKSKTRAKKLSSSSDECCSPVDSEVELKKINDYLYGIFLNDKPDPKKAGIVEPKKIVKKNSNHKSSQKSKSTSNKSEYPSFLASLSGNVDLQSIKLNYRPYRTNFQEHKFKLAKKLFQYYNEYIFDSKIPENTPLNWNNRMRGTAGFCYCKKVTKRTGVIERYCRIELATKVLDSADRLRDTLVHEMCHAATFIINEVNDGHGSFWQAWAKKAMKKFPELPPITTCHSYAINTKYSYVCTKCGYTIGRHSKSLDIERKRCGYCYSKFEVFVNKKKGGVQIRVPAKTTEATGFALFVKNNYHLIKKPNLNHGEVMKILGEKFNVLKIQQSDKE